MNVRWSKPALRDVAGIFAYISQHDERAAVHVVDESMAAGGTLAQHPRLARPGRVPGTRELVVGKYVLVYRVRGEVIIASVVHVADRT